jgi:hypothetical protein
MKNENDESIFVLEKTVAVTQNRSMEQSYAAVSIHQQIMHDRCTAVALSGMVLLMRAMHASTRACAWRVCECVSVCHCECVTCKCVPVSESVCQSVWVCECLRVCKCMWVSVSGSGSECVRRGGYAARRHISSLQSVHLEMHKAFVSWQKGYWV